MKEHGILFSGPMVRALLAGRKTQTRRGLNPQPPAQPAAGAYFDAYCGAPKTAANPRGMTDRWHWWTADHRPYSESVRCPHPPGTRLWVRETWAGDDMCGVVYRADHPNADLKAGELDDGEQSIREWRPSLHMPRWASRLTLDVVGVRVERAQAISDADVAAEGMDHVAVNELWASAPRKRRREVEAAFGWESEHAGSSIGSMTPPRDLWRIGWTLINGRASWDANPWCWVYELRRTTDAR